MPLLLLILLILHLLVPVNTTSPRHLRNDDWNTAENTLKVSQRQQELQEIHQGLREALRRWDQLATQHGIQYRIAFGSLLGWVRDRSIIPHDTDGDLVIDPSAVSILQKLALDPTNAFVLDAGDHSPLPPKDDDADDSPVFVLFRAKTHAQEYGTFPRVDCHGADRGHAHVDACSFEGPVGRIVHFGAKITTQKQQYFDIFLAGCHSTKEEQVASWHCRESTHDCSYCPSVYATPGALLRIDHSNR